MGSNNYALACKQVVATILLIYVLVPYLALGAAETSNSNSSDLELTAPSDYWNITDASQSGLDFSNQVTLAMWVKFETDPLGLDTAFFGKRVSSGSQRSYLLYMETASTLFFETQTNGTTQGCGQAASWNPTTATWYHIAVSKIGTQLKYYVNGSQIDTTKTCSSATIFNGTAPFQVGGWTDGSFFVDGIIDGVVAYNVGLNDAEVSSLYSTPCDLTVATSTNPVSQWRFNGNGNDSVGSNNLTATNGATAAATDVAYSCTSASPAASFGDFVNFE